MHIHGKLSAIKNLVYVDLRPYEEGKVHKLDCYEKRSSEEVVYRVLMMIRGSAKEH